MGKTSFSGPVYGAKGVIWTYGPYSDKHSTGASTTLMNDGSTGIAISAVTVPNYEDWFIT